MKQPAGQQPGSTGRTTKSRIQKALINRNYACLWYGQAISTVGNYMFATTLTLWVATVLAREPDGQFAAWAPVATSGVFLAEILAMATVGPLAGVFVDRWNRKRTMMRTETFRAMLTTGLFALAFTPRQALPVGVWLGVIYVVVFLINAAGCFFDPSRQATISEVVPGDTERARASGLGQATSATAGLIGPPLAAPLLFIAGFQWSLLVNAVSFVLSYLAIRSVQLPATSPGRQAPAGRYRTEFMDGLRFFAHNRFLVVLLVLAVTAQLGTGAMNALDVFFVTVNLHAAPKYFGFLATAEGIGAIIGGLTAGTVVRRIGARTLTWLALVLGGLLVLLYARQSVLLAGLAVMVSMLVLLTMVNTALMPLIFKATPVAVHGQGDGGLLPGQRGIHDGVDGSGRPAGQHRAAWLPCHRGRPAHGSLRHDLHRIRAAHHRGRPVRPVPAAARPRACPVTAKRRRYSRAISPKYRRP